MGTADLVDRFRLPWFVAALVLFVLALLVDVVGPSVLPPVPKGGGSVEGAMSKALAGSGMSDDEIKDAKKSASDLPSDAPGLGLAFLALLDGLVVYSVLLMALALLLPDRVQGRLQGILSLIVSLVGVIGSIILVIVAFVLLMVMVAMFLAVPFGTIAYLAIYGSFNTGGATAVLGVLMILKLAACVCLLIAHPRFLQNKGLVFLILTALLGQFVLTILHAIVPGILCSITDTLGAIVIAVLALIWLVVMLVFSVISLVKAVV
ncbi:MAG TPA: hypothetical protein VFG37_02060 [Planctomycetota bacterium]|nr:hypothetical protein [Planctomycetota bacterium]